MSQPTVIVEAGFGATMLTDLFGWTDISAYFRDGTISRGRTSVDGRFETGTATVTLDNRDGRFTPSNTSSPYYPDVQIGIPMRIRATWDNVTYPLFYGSVRAWPPSTPPGNIDSTVTVPLVDGFYTLQLEDLAQVSYDVETTDERITSVLTTIGWPLGLADLDAGIATVQATDFAQPETGGEQPALQHLLDVAESEIGVLFMAPSGEVTFRNRIASSGASPVATFDGSDDYTHIDLAYNDDYLWNVVRVEREDGAQVEIDASGAAPRRVLTRDVMPMGTDAEALSVGKWLTIIFGEQRLRVTGLRFKPMRDSSLMSQILAMELRDLVTVQHTPPGGDSLDQDCAVEFITHEIAPQDWTTTLQLAPLSSLETADFFILDTSVLDGTDLLA